MDLLKLFADGGFQLVLLGMLFYFMKKLFIHTSEVTEELKQVRLAVERFAGLLEGKRREF